MGRVGVKVEDVALRKSLKFRVALWRMSSGWGNRAIPSDIVSAKRKMINFTHDENCTSELNVVVAVLSDEK